MFLTPMTYRFQYYDCTNYYFEMEEADELRSYGKSKQHHPLPIIGMGMFVDHDGIPLGEKLDEKFTCEEIIHTLQSIIMQRSGEKLRYIPAYTRTDLTDTLHVASGFRTDYEIITDASMRRLTRQSKKK